MERRATLAFIVAGSQIALCLGQILLRRFAKSLHRFDLILLHALAMSVAGSQI